MPPDYVHAGSKGREETVARMSLKAKIEAVIYAAEEPVTLAQLAFLIGAEVVESLASRAAQAEASATTSPESGNPDLELTGQLADAASGAGSPSAEVDPTPEPVAESTAELVIPESLAGPTAEDQPADAPSAEVDEKKAARQRDREIREELRRILTELMDDYVQSDRGMEIREVAGGYRVATKPEYHDAVRAFVKSLKPPLKLSLQALETLAVIAYKQPVTAPEVSEIRGVDSSGVLGSLISRKLITTAGRKQVIGRPILYKTTKEFLLRFGLKDVNELPSIEEFEKMAGEVEIAEQGQDMTSSQDLPFTEEDSVANDAVEGDEAAVDSVEANAAEPGLAVEMDPAQAGQKAAPDEDPPISEQPISEQMNRPAPATIPLDAPMERSSQELAAEAVQVEVAPAAHPTVPIEGE